MRSSVTSITWFVRRSPGLGSFRPCCARLKSYHRSRVYTKGGDNCRILMDRRPNQWRFNDERRCQAGERSLSELRRRGVSQRCGVGRTYDSLSCLPDRGYVARKGRGPQRTWGSAGQETSSSTEVTMKSLCQQKEESASAALSSGFIGWDRCAICLP